MKKLSRAELIWGLSHEEEYVFFPTFCYWVKSFLTDDVIFGKKDIFFEGLDCDKQLIAEVGAVKLGKYTRLAIQEVLNTCDNVNFGTVRNLLVDNDDVDGVLPIAIAAYENLRKFPWKFEDAWKIEKQSIFNTINVLIVRNFRYELIARKLDVYPEFLKILTGHEMAISKMCLLEFCNAMEGSIHTLLARAKKHKNTKLGKESFKFAEECILWMINFREQFYDKCFLEVTRVLDWLADYYPKLRNENVKAIKNLPNDYSDYQGLIHYIVTESTFSMTGKLKVLSVLFDKKISQEIDAYLFNEVKNIRSYHQEEIGTYVPFLKRYLERYPDSFIDVSLFLENVLNAYFKTDAWRCWCDKFSDLKRSEQNLILLSAKLKAQRGGDWNYVRILQLYVENPEFESQLEPMLQKCLDNSQDYSWLGVCSSILDDFIAEIEWLASCDRKIADAVGRWCRNSLKRCVLPQKLLGEIRLLAQEQGFFIEEAQECQEELRAEARQAKLQAKAKEEEIQAFLKKLK